MSYSDILIALLDLPAVKVLEEAPSKLQDTIMFVNGNLVYMRRIRGDGVEFIPPKTANGVTLAARDVKSMDVWLPRTGVYFHKETGEAVFLQRQARRQWKRSFSDSFYRMEYFSESSFPIVEVDTTSLSHFWVSKGNSLLYHNSAIGKVVSDDTVICTNPLFEQEIRDWMKGKDTLPFYQTKKEATNGSGKGK